MSAAGLCITTDLYDEGGPIEPRLAEFAAAGFTHVHWCEHWTSGVLYEDFYTRGVGRCLESAGLVLLDTHGAENEKAGVSSPDEDCRGRGVRLMANRLHFTAALGGGCVVIHPGPAEDPDSPPARLRWENLERSVAGLAPLCEELGVPLALENTSRPTAPAFFELLRRFPSSVLGFCYDSGHANLRGADPDLLGKLAGRLIALHLHDNRGERDEHALPGRGTVNWDLIAGRLRGMKYPRPLNYELSLRSCDLDAPEFLRQAYAAGCRLTERIG
jgi:sugar phosphate isomerase/epimerase